MNLFDASQDVTKAAYIAFEKLKLDLTESEKRRVAGLMVNISATAIVRKEQRTRGAK